ncbi:MAG: competence/damage-inducible protein A [Verrucomicrobiia bacterium]
MKKSKFILLICKNVLTGARLLLKPVFEGLIKSNNRMRLTDNAVLRINVFTISGFRTVLFIWAVWGCLLFTVLTHKCKAASGEGIAPTNYFIIVTGGELLEGVYPDSHTSFITRTLLPLGLRCVGSMIVDDNKEEIIWALKYATNKTSLIITTGGLGPTANDITRETLSEFTRIPLIENQQLVKQMEKRFNVARENLRQNLLKQTMTPAVGGYLNNVAGTAAGLIFEMNNIEIIALPGPPRELQKMVSEQLLPYLEKKYGIRAPQACVTARFIGIGQSQIDETLRNKIKIDPDIIMTSVFEGSRVDFTFSLKGNLPQDFNRLHALLEKLQANFGEAIYSTNGASLESVVAMRLRARGINQVIIADACRAHFLDSVQKCDDFRHILLGAYSAPSGDSLRRLVKIDDSRWGALKTPKDQTDYIAATLFEQIPERLAVCIGEPIKSDGGEYKLFVSVKSAVYNDTSNFSLRDFSEQNLSYLTTQILDRLRRNFK